MPDSTSHSVRRDGRCPSCGLSPYERGIGDADISRIVAERNRLVEQLEALRAERDHYRDHSPAGRVSYEDCEALDCEEARERYPAKDSDA